VVVVVFAAISGEPAAPGAASLTEELDDVEELEEMVVLNGFKPPSGVKNHGGSIKAWRPGTQPEKAGSTP
jgi:hypothetical protein